MKYLKPLYEQRSAQLPTIEAAVEVIRKHCTQWASSPDGPQLYRGRKMSEDGLDGAMITDPHDAYRVPRAGEKFAAYMRNDPAWAAYPHRTSSIMAATDEELTTQFAATGKVYVVIPFDGATVAICPSGDFNYDDYYNEAFPYFKKQIGSREPRSLLNTLWFVGSQAQSENAPGINMPTIATLYVKYILTAEFRDAIEKWVKDDQRSMNDLVANFYRAYDENKSQYPSIAQYFAHVSDPALNRFKAGPYAELREHFVGRHEVWTDSKCLLVNVKSLDQLVHLLEEN